MPKKHIELDSKATGKILVPLVSATIVSKGNTTIIQVDGSAYHVAQTYEEVKQLIEKANKDGST